MKKYIIIIISILVFVLAFVFLRKKKVMFQNLEFEAQNAKINLPINNLSDAAKALDKLSSLKAPVSFDLNIKNPSNDNIELKNVYVNCYDNKGNLIASQQDLKNISISKNSLTNTTKFNYSISLSNLLKLYYSLKGQSGNLEALIDIAQNYWSTNKIGLDLILKGVANYAGIDININTKISI